MRQPGSNEPDTRASVHAGLAPSVRQVNPGICETDLVQIAVLWLNGKSEAFRGTVDCALLATAPVA
jgi:hypothetical protein